MHVDRARLAVSLSALALLLLSNAGIGAAPSDEASFRGGPAHPGVYAAPAIRRIGGLLWKAQTDGPVRSSPALAGGLVFVGSGDGRLYAFDEKTGRERWRFQTGGAVDSSPAVSGGRVFAASRDGSLYALDAATGKEIWRAGGRQDLPFAWGFDYFVSSPAVASGNVFVGSGDGTVGCWRADTGQRLWTFRAAARVRSSPAVAGGVVYVGGMDGFLYALDAATGKLKWKYATDGASIDSAKAGFDRTSINSSPAVAGNVITFGSRDAHQYALDAASGRLLWRIAHPVAYTKDHAELAWCEGSPAIADGVTYVGSSDGFFVNAAELESGRQRWRTAMPSRMNSSPAIAGDTLVAGCENGRVYGLDLKDGRVLWSFQTRDVVDSSPAIGAGIVYVGSGDGAVYALSAEGGPGLLPWRAVYWDEKSAGHYFLGGRQLRDVLVNAGYNELDAEGLTPFLAARAQDRAPSVIAFASDALPGEALSAAGGSTPLVRRYLEAGGRMLWPGGPPLALACDAKTGKMTGFDGEGSKRILDVASDFGSSSIEERRVAATPAGAEHGLPPWWLGSLAIPSAEGVTVLGTDSSGRPSSWVKTFGERGRFLRFWGRTRELDDPQLALKLAEHELR